jgi:hypothetical protein
MADDSFSPWDIAPEGFHRYDFDEASQFMNAMDFDRQYLLSDTDADQTNEEVLASAPSMASSIVVRRYLSSHLLFRPILRSLCF